MSVIAKVPTWAQPYVTSFRETGELPGESQRQPIPEDSLDEATRELTRGFQELVQLDNSEADQNPAVGELKIEIDGGGWMPDMKMEASFEGTPENGAMVIEQDLTAIYTEFSPEGVDMVGVIGLDGQPMGAQAAHIDRQNPGQSYLLQQGEFADLRG